MGASIVACRRGLRLDPAREVPTPAAAKRNVKIRHAAVRELARELGLQAPLAIRRNARLRTAGAIHWARVYVWGEILDHSITVAGGKVDPRKLAHSIGHELTHALDCEAILAAAPKPKSGQDNAWARYCDRHYWATVTGSGIYSDQKHEQDADYGGALLEHRILRDCLVVS